MQNKYKLQDLTIKDQAYYIIVGLNGSWLYDALYPHIKDESFCQRIVDKFLCDYSYEDCDTLGITLYVNEVHDHVLEYRAMSSIA